MWHMPLGVHRRTWCVLKHPFLVDGVRTRRLQQSPQYVFHVSLHIGQLNIPFLDAWRSGSELRGVREHRHSCTCHGQRCASPKQHDAGDSTFTAWQLEPPMANWFEPAPVAFDAVGYTLRVHGTLCSPSLYVYSRLCLLSVPAKHDSVLGQVLQEEVPAIPSLV